MKNLTRIGIFFFSISIFLFSCDNQSCEDVICPGNNSVCVNGQCVCPAGYEGVNCDEESRMKYIGNYQVSESCTTSSQGLRNNQFSANIGFTNRLDVITISNFSGFGLPFDATIVSANYLGIPSQSVGGTQLSGGEGTYEAFSNRIVLEYNYTSSGNANACTAYYSKF